TRFSPPEAANQNQIRISFDAATNTIFGQAAPADQAEILDLIKFLDTEVSLAINDIRIVPLRNAVADEMTNLLLRAITDAVAGVYGRAAGIGTATGQVGQAGQFGQQGQAGQFGQQGVQGAQGAIGRSSNTTTSGIATKAVTLRFQTLRNQAITGLLEDIHI